MADRTHEDEDVLTHDQSKPRRQGDPKPATAPAGSHQEGRGDSISGAADEFISSEVNEKTARPGHPSKTRG